MSKSQVYQNSWVRRGPMSGSDCHGSLSSGRGWLSRGSVYAQKLGWQKQSSNVLEMAFAPLDKFWAFSQVDTLISATEISTLCYISSQWGEFVNTNHQNASASGGSLPGCNCQSLCLWAETDSVGYLFWDRELAKKIRQELHPNQPLQGILTKCSTGNARVHDSNIDLVSHLISSQ